MLNFKKYKEVDFPVAKLRNVKDVKSEATKEQTNIDQLVAQGSLPELPMVTLDGVEFKGRTGVKAEIVWGTVGGVLPTTVRVNVLPWEFDTLTEREKAEFWAESLRADWAVDNTYRVFANNADLEKNLVEAIQAGSSKPAVLSNYAFVGETLLKKVFAVAFQRVLQSDLNRISNYAVSNGFGLPLTDAAIRASGNALGLPVTRIEQVVTSTRGKRAHHPIGGGKRTASTVFKKEHQKHFNSLLAVLSQNARKYRDELVNGEECAKFVREMGELFALWSQKVVARGKEASETLTNAALAQTPRTPKI